jgi:alpha-tubulin suppressor-like RCC1 family protein
MPLSRALVAALVIAGCGDPPAYRCELDDQCVDRGSIGKCAPQGMCAFPDTMCPSGYRLNSGAADGLEGACLEVESGPCGRVGEACCPTGPACTNATCDNGTCKSCIDQLELGRRFSCALRTDHTIWCVGDNTNGQLGIGTLGGASAQWQQVRDTQGPIVDATSIGLGKIHGCATRVSGAVWCWGWNSRGQLGDGGATDQPSAVRVIKNADNMPLVGMEQVEGGDEFSCARGGGNVWCWGRNGEGHLGDGTTAARAKAAPVLNTPGGTNFSGAVALRSSHDTSCAQKADATVFCWGENYYGMLGLDSVATPYVTSPLSIGAWSAFALGRRYLCRVNSASQVLCTGRNYRGTFGNGTIAGEDTSTIHKDPVTVLAGPGVPFTGAVDVAIAGGGGTCARMADTGVYCWGNGIYGQTATTSGEPYPVRVLDGSGEPLAQIDQLIADLPHVCARSTAGAWSCWGRNSDGEFGDGTYRNRNVPSPLELSCD